MTSPRSTLERAVSRFVRPFARTCVYLTSPVEPLASGQPRSCCCYPACVYSWLPLFQLVLNLLLDAQQQLGMSHGTLFGVPIPEQYEAIGQELQQSVEAALQEAEDNGVNKLGKEATPWLLKRVGELTNGKSLGSSKRSQILIQPIGSQVV